MKRLMKYLFGGIVILVLVVVGLAMLSDDKTGPVTDYITRIENTQDSDQLFALCEEAVKAVSDDDARVILEAMNKNDAEGHRQAVAKGKEHLMALEMHCLMAGQRLSN